MTNYQIMTKKDKNGEYIPDYDILIRNANNEQERRAWERAKEYDERFAYNMVRAVKFKCGHYEILQHPIRFSWEAKETIKALEEYASETSCTRCKIHGSWEI